MLVMIAVVAVSCNKDNDDEPDPNGGDIVGTWVCTNFVDDDEIFSMCFKSNGTGWMRWSDGSSEDDYDEFEYTTNAGKIYFSGWGETWTCKYSVKGNKLSIYGNPWGEDDDIDELHFTRK